MRLHIDNQIKQEKQIKKGKDMSDNQKSVGLNCAFPTGSLEANTIQLLTDAGFPMIREPRRHRVYTDSSLISSATWIRPQHVAYLVSRGVYDVAICGLDCVRESNTEVSEVAALSYGRDASNGRARVVLVAAQRNPAQSIRDVKNGSLVLSEYPFLTKKYFAALGISVEVCFSYGSTEAHIPSDYEYGVCLTDTGASLAANELKMVHTLLETYTCLITSPEIWSVSSWLEVPEHPKKELVLALKHLLCGTLAAREQTLLKMNVSAERKSVVLAMLPALKAPTVAPLADGKSFAIETVVPKKDANEIIVKAAQAGAEGILELPITKMIPKW